MSFLLMFTFSGYSSTYVVNGTRNIYTSSSRLPFGRRQTTRKHDSLHRHALSLHGLCGSKNVHSPYIRPAVCGSAVLSGRTSHAVPTGCTRDASFTGR